MPFIAPCGHAYSNTPATTLILADERKKMYIGFCCAASGKPEEEFVCMNVKTIEKNLKIAKSLLPFASRTVQSSLPPKLKHVEVILAACQDKKASILKCSGTCTS